MQGFTQRELRTPIGVVGRFVKRNAPTLLNVAYHNRDGVAHPGPGRPPPGDTR